MAGYVHIATNRKLDTRHIGVTSNLERPVFEHHESATPRFTSKMRLQAPCLIRGTRHNHVYHPEGKIPRKMIAQWKIKLIEQMKPDWRNLYEEL